MTPLLPVTLLLALPVAAGVGYMYGGMKTEDRLSLEFKVKEEQAQASFDRRLASTIEAAVLREKQRATRRNKLFANIGEECRNAAIDPCWRQFFQLRSTLELGR